MSFACRQTSAAGFRTQLRRRTATCLVLCSAIFGQIASLSAFQIRLALPSNENEWQAGSANEWYRLYASVPRPQPFLTTIKVFLMPGLTEPDLSPLARVICLHGLLSVAFDMQWRENFLLGLSTHPDGLVKEWRLTLVRHGIPCIVRRSMQGRALLTMNCLAVVYPDVRLQLLEDAFRRGVDECSCHLRHATSPQLNTDICDSTLHSGRRYGGSRGLCRRKERDGLASGEPRCLEFCDLKIPKARADKRSVARRRHRRSRRLGAG